MAGWLPLSGNPLVSFYFLSQDLISSNHSLKVSPQSKPWPLLEVLPSMNEGLELGWASWCWHGLSIASAGVTPWGWILVSWWEEVVCRKEARRWQQSWQDCGNCKPEVSAVLQGVICPGSLVWSWVRDTSRAIWW